MFYASRVYILNISAVCAAEIFLWGESRDEALVAPQTVTTVSGVASD
jgi:hypothetical protein